MKKIENKTQIRRNNLLEDVAETIAGKLIKELKIPEEKAADIGNALADFLADHWKKQTIYIPEDWRYKTRERDQEIYEEMTRGNANEIAAKFGISAVRVYQIYRRIREDKQQHESNVSTAVTAENPINVAVL